MEVYEKVRFRTDFPCREGGMGRRGDPQRSGVVLVSCQPKVVGTCARLSPPAEQPGHHIPVLCWQPECLNFERATNQ